MDYQAFLQTKAIIDAPAGFEPGPLPDALFDFQRDIVRWACRRGRSAIFADCGLGKTPMQLAWAAEVCRHTGGSVLILAPLAVAEQTVREGQKFGIAVTHAAAAADLRTGVNITNYEKLAHFESEAFAGIVLDESSILKAYDGKTRTQIIRAFGETPYRLACTATPAPNDYMELGNHAEFLGAMTREEMLSMFFVHDGGETQQWRIKGHAETEFWRWICSWAVMMRKPSDIGYDDGAFVLPPLEYHDIVVPVEKAPQDSLFPMEAVTLQERIRERRDTVSARVARLAEIVNASDEPWLIWCNLNSEADAIVRAVRDAVDVRGSDDEATKSARLLGFRDGDPRILSTKPTIGGYGMNWQHCRNIAFVGLSDSWEQYYQAVRRCWRFGQRQPVHVYVITAETEGAVVANIKRKESDAAAMAENMVSHMHDLNAEALHGTTRTKDEYRTGIERGEGWTLHLGDCVEVAQSLPSDSLHYSIFSPPFASLYTYSASDRDMGNCADDAEFAAHFGFLIKELFRCLMPGRLVSFHCMNLPTSKTHHGYIGIRDFRGDLIRQFESAGFIYHSEVCIWKDPVTAMQRTKALGLLHKQLKKDSCMSRQGIPDYLVTMRKPGDNPQRVTHTNESFPVEAWQRYASPVWMDINPSDTLQFRSAREHQDEKHICPLQLQVIQRAIELWTNPGDLVFSPFAGIGSEGYVALQNGRTFVGAELKPSYFRQACANLKQAKRVMGDLLDAAV